jgi:drug/metabolite transporter superfamily protein YnfA
MSFLRFHSSASASSDAFRSATASSDTAADERGRENEKEAKMDPAATYAVIVALFFAAGVLEIGGGWMWWQALREGKPWWYAVIGSAMLCLYGVVPTFQPQTAGTEDFGRVYAAYGCWFIMLSLAWGWAVDGNRPDAGDGIGAGLAAVGAVVITFYPRS